MTTNLIEAPSAGADSFANSAHVAAAVLELLAQADSSLDSDHNAVRVYLTRAAALIAKGRVDRPVSREPMRSARRGLPRWQVNRLKAYVDANLGSTIRARDLTAVVHLSVSHFFRSFKESFGEAPFAYVARRRIQRAQQMMLTTGEPLAQIALACGLCDQSHLTRVFRRIVGMNPKTWRREHAAAEVVSEQG